MADGRLERFGFFRAGFSICLDFDGLDNAVGFQSESLGRHNCCDLGGGGFAIIGLRHNPVDCLQRRGNIRDICFELVQAGAVSTIHTLDASPTRQRSFDSPCHVVSVTQCPGV